MKKIPTLFVRDWEGDRSRVLDDVTPGCEWVIEGEGRPTRKWDGTCCAVRGGMLFKRYTAKMKGGRLRHPAAFIPCTEPDERGKVEGWVPVSDGPEDKWHRTAFGLPHKDGTYELIGPKVQGNPEGVPIHILLQHGGMSLSDCERTFDGIRDFLREQATHSTIEGIVWHHSDGRLAKIKLCDFGITRGKPSEEPTP